jgi:4-phospho-D-threonate 3-dehydrogenase / 4-phospho-D-erythronate 3-dehydrogenase
MKKPCIAITMGDPAGVGPEVCLHALASEEMNSLCVPVVFGDAAVLEKCAQQLGLPIPPQRYSAAELPLATQPGVLHIPSLELADFTPGQISADTGRAAYTYVNQAIDASLARQISAITTAPLNKEAMHLAGLKFPGHTEILATRTQAARSCMMQYSQEITCTFVTVHVGYHEVPQLLTTARILEVIELTREALLRIRGYQPKIVVCGLNPHAGEHGLFGNREEERLIQPAIDAARAQGMDIEGPLPPDTAFLPWKRETTDAFVCMYHDQGHIPVKALAFDSAVNTTLGLPIIRTSVDHGTALDIAWQGKARPSSLFSALRLATLLAT